MTWFSPIAYLSHEIEEYNRMMIMNNKSFFFYKKTSNLEAHNCETKCIPMFEGALSVIATEM